MAIYGFIAFSSSPSPWQPPIPHQNKKFVAPIIVSCIFRNTTAALSVHSNLPPRHHHHSLRHPSAHHHSCHHQHRITGHSSRYMDDLLTAALRSKIPPHAAGPSALVPVLPPRYRRPPSALALASNCSSLPSSPPGPCSDSLAILLMVRWWLECRLHIYV